MVDSLRTLTNERMQANSVTQTHNNAKQCFFRMDGCADGNYTLYFAILTTLPVSHPMLEKLTFTYDVWQFPNAVVVIVLIS